MRNASVLCLINACLSLLLFSPAFTQWVQTNGPEGGYINVIFNDVTSGNIFVGGNGFSKSGDNGVTWTNASSGMDGNSSPVAVVRSGANLFAASLDKVYFSTDNGNSWTLRGTVPAQVLSMGVIGTTLIAGTNVFGVYRSTNDGVSWVQATGFPPSNNIVLTIATVGGRLLAGLGGKGVWASTDHGASWSQSSSGLGNTRSVNGLAVHSANVFAATSDSAVLMSTNGGVNWSSSASGMHFRASVSAIGSNGSTLLACVAGAFGGVDTGGVYRSTNNGSLWVSVKYGLYSPTPNCVGFGTGGKLLAGLGVGIYASTNNGANWFASNSGLRNANAFAMTASGSTLFAGHAGGISRTQDEGATWTTANNGLAPGTGVLGMTTHGSYFFAAAGLVYRSSDNGASWVPMGSGITNPYINTLSAGGNSIYAGGGITGGVFVSTNDGASWTGPGIGLGFGAVSSIFVDGTTLWAGVGSDGVYRSTDNGATWTASNTGLPAFSKDVCSVVRSGTNLFLGLTTSFGAGSGAVWMSTNNGGNWTVASTGIPSGSYLFTLYSVGQFVFAGFNYQSSTLAVGIYRTSNNGANWTPVNDGLPNPSSINSITVMGTNMYASYLGVYKRPLSQVTSVREIAGGMPGRFALDQNYPNPFNPSTNIRFQIAAEGMASLKVYDALGREVATLVNEKLNAGSYETTFSPVGLSSGVYYYTLNSGIYTQTKKLILMK